jgi:hypothetical protein
MCAGLLDSSASRRRNYGRERQPNADFAGAKPAYLRVEQPTKFDLVVNLIVAKTLDLEVPPMVLARVDEVIE